MENWIERALDADIAGVMVWVFIGTPRQTCQSVLDAVTYCASLTKKFRMWSLSYALWYPSWIRYHTVANESVGVVLAMQTTKVGQMRGLVGEVWRPAFEKHYDFKPTARDRIFH